MKRGFYGDGVTKVTDPFWEVKCKNCGHNTWSVTYKDKCSKCGGNVTCNTAGKKEEKVLKGVC